MNFCVLFFVSIISISADVKIPKNRNIWFAHVNVPPENTYIITRHNPVDNPLPVYPVHVSAASQNMLTDQFVGNPLMACTEEQFKCSSPHQCIPKDHQCNGYVDCIDASDEKTCDCVSRLDKTKKCDSYFDCPDGEDELGCFGCGADQYSCYENEIEHNKHTRHPQCFKHPHRCDGIIMCENRKDELGCSILSKNVLPSSNKLLLSTNGILHHYLGFQAYPVCADGIGILKAACSFALGDNFSNMEFEYVATSYNGMFVSGSRNFDTPSAYQLVNDCRPEGFNSSNAVLVANCISKSECGTQQNLTRNKDSPRISGGTEAIPKSNPWLVALFVNGTFQCAGTIINRKWVLTAAHCLPSRKELFVYDYVEVRAGITRLKSFSPNEQSIRVERGMIHENYNKQTSTNDIALLRLEEDLIFNKFTQPLCLPSKERVGDKPNRQWILGPEDSICRIAGWGAYTDRGPFPVDFQMEVNVPIVSNSTCVPQNEKFICAGYEEGGFDTCIGDSGGPLACRSKVNEQYYLAGITSTSFRPTASEGSEVSCGEAGTYGLYTGLTWYIPWIENMKVNKTYGKDFRKKCPGVKCMQQNRCAIRNGIVDCVSAEDEN